MMEKWWLSHYMNWLWQSWTWAPVVPFAFIWLANSIKEGEFLGVWLLVRPHQWDRPECGPDACQAGQTLGSSHLLMLYYFRSVSSVTGYDWHSLRFATTRNQVFHHRGTTHRLHGRAVSGRFRVPVPVLACSENSVYFTERDFFECKFYQIGPVVLPSGFFIILF